MVLFSPKATLVAVIRRAIANGVTHRLLHQLDILGVCALTFAISHCARLQ